MTSKISWQKSDRSECALRLWLLDADSHLWDMPLLTSNGWSVENITMLALMMTVIMYKHARVAQVMCTSGTDHRDTKLLSLWTHTHTHTNQMDLYPFVAHHLLVIKIFFYGYSQWSTPFLSHYLQILCCRIESHPRDHIESPCNFQ